MKITPDLKRFLVEANAMRDARRERKAPRRQLAHGPGAVDVAVQIDGKVLATIGTHQLASDRLQAVEDSLAGKIKCSACGAGFFGNEYKTSPGIAVIRYIGYDTPNLIVDLLCLGCDHGGIYKFEGNPLMDTGFDADAWRKATAELKGLASRNGGDPLFPKA